MWAKGTVALAIADNSIHQYIRRLLGETHLRLTPRDLMRLVGEHLPDANRAEIHRAIGQMVADGEVVYTQQCATTHLQMARFGAVIPAKRPGMREGNLDPGPEQKSPGIRLVPGLSFGAGDHPTTCLSLEGLAEVSRTLSIQKKLSSSRILDIGTGSGILAIGAVLQGFGWALGVDIDPAACIEARRNANLNGVAASIGWIAGTLDSVGRDHYELILANLRPPTLVGLMPRMAELLRVGGYWILSGFRPQEAEAVKKNFPEKIEMQRLMQNRGWAAMVARLNK